MGKVPLRHFSILMVLALVLTSAFMPIHKEKEVDSTPKFVPVLDEIQPDIVSGTLCLTRGTVPEEELHWLYIPSSASELHTEVGYLYLAGQLIQYGVVDASICPAGGLSAAGYANACGLSKARSLVIELQNLYDDEILQAWHDVSVPPVMLKQLIRYESQFWPLQFGAYHFGLGHLTYGGAYAALLWSPILYETTCNMAYGANCNNRPADDVMAGTLMGLMNASCPTCPYKFDVAKAEASIYYLAHTLLAFCKQTAQIVYNATEKTPGLVVDYATIWKLTLFNYNMGPNCVYSAVQRAYTDLDRVVTWDDISTRVYEDFCRQGVDYVNGITGKFYDFPP
jgi:hypothetical protein